MVRKMRRSGLNGTAYWVSFVLRTDYRFIYYPYQQLHFIHTTAYAKSLWIAIHISLISSLPSCGSLHLGRLWGYVQHMNKPPTWSAGNLSLYDKFYFWRYHNGSLITEQSTRYILTRNNSLLILSARPSDSGTWQLKDSASDNVCMVTYILQLSGIYTL